MCHILSSDGEDLKTFVAIRIQSIPAIREIIVCVCNSYLVTLSVAKGFGFGGKVMNEKGLFVE
jgi:hypothetical protein